MPSARDVAAILEQHLPPGRPGLAEELGRFCEVLAATNESINLTGITDAEGMAVRHVLDSLLALPLLEGCTSLMDLGTGGGLPGVPLAIARPDLAVTLVESRERKVAALQGMLDRLGLAPRVTAVHARGEEWLAAHTVDTVIVRAVSETAELLERLRKVRKRMQRLVLLKGPFADRELATVTPRLPRLGFALTGRHEASLPGEAGARVLLVFEPR
jgi:16S rRNA (guanine527-N7)-methyltransferase